MAGIESSRLSGRLAALRSGKTAGTASVSPDRNPTDKTAGTQRESVPGPPGWTETAPLVFRRELTFPAPGETTHSGRLLEVTGLKGAEDGMNFPGHNLEDFLFYDLETTGLSGGAGNMAFLAGAGRYSGGDFRLEQLFLADYPGEPSFLESVAAMMDPEKIWVSYNGRAFDTSLLRTRFLMNRKVFREGSQLDLLYPSRRLWKSLLPDCSLGTVEREILGKEREEDIPGMLIPDLYFQALRTGNLDLLSPVFAHHKEDILSLAELYFRIEEILSGSRSRVFDFGGAGYLLQHTDLSLALEFLESGLSEGSLRAGMILGDILKRRQEWESAEQVWMRLWETFRNISSAVEAAKIREHRFRDYSRALELVEAVLSDCSDLSLIPELSKRRERLLEKIQRYGAGETLS